MNNQYNIDTNAHYFVLMRPNNLLLPTNNTEHFLTA